MSQDKYLAAIEISSSKITLAVGRQAADGHIYISAVEQEPTVECVCHGVIHNVEEVSSIIGRLIDRAERRPSISPRKITKMYVGLTGRSLRNVPREISRNLPDDTIISQEILDNLRDDALHSHIDSSLEIIDAMPSTYFVNKAETRSAVGTSGSSLRAQYQLIAARPLLRKHLTRVVSDKSGIGIAGFVITPVAAGDLILSSEEKRLGCMLVDLGAETTTVSIYRSGALSYLAVLPMGGRSITTDITSLNVLEERAEEIKTTSGNAIPSENPPKLNLDGVRLSDVSNIVVARAEEITANILEQITYAGIEDNQLPGGIITIGGGFNLNRMTELLKRQSNLNVRRGSLPSSVIIDDMKAPSYESIQVAAIMHAGAAGDAECLEIPRREELPVTGEALPEELPATEEELQTRNPEPRRRRGFGWGKYINDQLAKIFRDSGDDPEIE